MIDQLLGQYFYSEEIIEFMESLELQKNVKSNPVSESHMGALSATIFLLRQDIIFTDDFIQTEINGTNITHNVLSRGRIFNSFKEEILHPLQTEDSRRETFTEICYDQGVEPFFSYIPYNFSKNMIALNEINVSKGFKLALNKFLETSDVFYLDLYLNFNTPKREKLLENPILEKYYPLIKKLME